MNAALTIGALALILAPIAFTTMTVIEARRVWRFLRAGVRTDGEIIGEELHGVRYRASYPVVRFRDCDGSIRQFRSRISKKTAQFIHPEKVTVIYLPERPDMAELFSGFHPYKHLVGITFVLMLSVAFAIFALPMFFD